MEMIREANDVHRPSMGRMSSMNENGTLGDRYFGSLIPQGVEEAFAESRKGEKRRYSIGGERMGERCVFIMHGRV